ncbi:MAG: ABATE domain-containing protein [bacterium]
MTPLCYIPAMATPYDHELVGGHPALDFLNTIHDWMAEEPRDYLTDFSDAIRFGEAVGLLTRSEALRLGRMPAGAECARLRRLRLSLERMFRARVDGVSPEDSDLADLATVSVEVARAVEFLADGTGPFERAIPIDTVGAAALRLRVADQAAELLCSPQLARVKTCPSCGWFFIDASKNRSRRWCSMNTCGASAKGKTYYRRTHSA